MFWVSLIFYKKRNNLKDSEIMDHLAKDLAYGKYDSKNELILFKEPQYRDKCDVGMAKSYEIKRTKNSSLQSQRAKSVKPGPERVNAINMNTFMNMRLMTL